MRKSPKEYRERQHGALLVDTQAAINAAMEHIHPMTLAWDRIHPGTVGHMILANAFLHGIGAKS